MKEGNASVLAAALDESQNILATAPNNAPEDVVVRLNSAMEAGQENVKRLNIEALTKHLDATAKQVQDQIAAMKSHLAPEAQLAICSSLKMEMYGLRLSLICEGVESDLVVKKTEDVLGELTELERTAQRSLVEAQLEQHRSYQRWAIGKIQSFHKAFGAEEDDAKQQGWKPGQNWWARNYYHIKDAMLEHLVPIDRRLLDEPVADLFASAWSKGWEKLKEHDDNDLRQSVAVSSVEVKKKSLEEIGEAK